MEIWFYRTLPRIDVKLQLTCHDAAIGDFFADETKLNVYWPLGFAGEVCHDIPFGVVQTRAGRPFFPLSWVDISDGQRGFAYFNKGTQRHWLNGRTLGNVLAWGNETNRIGNRLHSGPWAKSFDQRLKGTHLIEYAIFPHSGTWQEAKVLQVARAYQTLLLAEETSLHSGELPPRYGLLEIGPENVVVTAVLPHEQGMQLRLYESAGRETALFIQGDHLLLTEMTALTGERLGRLAPFQIAHIGLAR